jgi:pheromone shutdown protein TraB
MSEFPNVRDGLAKTTVVILGTVHLNKENAPEYIKALENIVAEINPDIICPELSPEQLERPATCLSKPEYPDAIVPTARRMGILVVPIQSSDKESLAATCEARKTAIYDKVKSKESGRFLLEYMEKVSRITLSNLTEVMQNVEAIEHVQLREFDRLQFEPFYIADREYFPELDKLWEEWNQYFLDRIQDTITKHPGKLILVTVGLAHKYWLWNKLESREHIILHNLQSFRQARERTSLA